MEITPLELHQKLDAGEDITLLDIREKEEHDFANIGGTHIPMGEISSRLNELEEDDNIVVYCHHGIRSAQVAAFLMQQGFTNITNMSGGIDRWSCDVDSSVPRY